MLQRIICIVTTAVMLAVLVTCYICFVPSGSMIPTLQIGDFLIARKTQVVERNDIIVFYADGKVCSKISAIDNVLNRIAGSTVYVKRVIGLPGDTIEVRQGLLLRNGVIIPDEEYQFSGTIDEDFGPVTVPEGMVFVMGDNRNNSYDSRYIGPISTDQIMGRVVAHGKIPVLSKIMTLIINR